MQSLSHYLLLLSLILCSCKDRSPAPDEIKKQYSTSGVIAQPPFAFNYEAQKKRCKELFIQNKEEASSESKTRLINFIADSLLACWYGTPWDFNGTTQTPQTGNIACGYFVTTTLRDAGMEIDRVKLAQCASEQLVKTTCTDIQRFSNKSLVSFVEAVKKSGYGLYIVGLDNHTGYIYHDGRDIWFIHSGFLPPRCTLKEKALESETLRRSAYRVLGRIIL